MSALESMIASNPSGEAPIHPALAFELPAPSTSVVDRKQHCRAYPSSASSLTFTGAKTCRIRLGGEGFVDPSSLVMQYTITNLSADRYLRPLGGPWLLWQQVYLRSAGVELDNIPYYNRWHQQMGWLNATRGEQFGSLGIQGFHLSSTSTLNPYKPNVGQLGGLASITVQHRLHLSVLNSGKMIPVKYMPLELECSMVNDLNDFLLPASAVENSGTQSFVVSNVQVLYDEYQLDDAILQAFYSSLLKNRVMSIPVMTAYQIFPPIPAGSTTYSFSSVRAFSRLAQVWLTFRNTGPRGTSFVCPGNTGPPVKIRRFPGLRDPRVQPA